MTPKEHLEFSKYVKKMISKIRKDKKLAKEILIGTGMYTPDGKLKKELQ